MKKILVLLVIIGLLLTASVYAATFTDLTSDHWAYETIMKMADSGIINGYPDGTFMPQKNVTRAEFSKILVQSLNSKI